MKTLVVLLGPTAVGKTELSLSLAKLLSSPVISADSRQIYKTLSIGTAAPTEEQLQMVKHYFVHQLELDEYYSAAQFESDVLTLLKEHFEMHDYALMSGGSMMYIDAVCKGIDDIPTISDDVREMMHVRLEQEGLDALKAELKMIDPDYYAIADLKNPKRIVHALEIYYQSGKPFSRLRTNTAKERPFRIVKIGLTRSREQLFQRINQRVDEMMQQGLMDEVRSVYALRHLNSLNTVGYKELFKVLDGEWELPIAVERIKKNTRVYAKKQMTWFKHDTDIDWLNLDHTSVEEAISFVKMRIKNDK